ncbi:transposase IS116/IS110/IS902 family protein [Melghiribacillus thermohalophilus]|uniref:Transposase IS116/IS110/IS902 family protein n=1 Tax=Melghiribacillus thermohalophilus TaxID=1324956 RepID=A0A4R3MX39_9BACI|nr:transposase IS116/IS110/IS902 family protein [Melghiribacillus thermohalophilus]
MEQYDRYHQQLNRLDTELETVVETIPGAQQMMGIDGLGAVTVALFLTKVGDLSRYSHPQQLVNPAGLSLREYSFGKYKGQTRIAKRE